MSADSSEKPAASPPRGPLEEIVKPFVDVIHAPRALWGINLGYFIEGMAYFGIVMYLVMFFHDNIGLTDEWSGRLVGVLTAGITIAMVLLGGVSDRIGVRRSLLLAYGGMLIGRILLTMSPTVGSWFGVHFQSVAVGVALFGILWIVTGYGLYQPSAYAAVRQFTDPKTAGMAYAMLYAVMNLGGFLPFFAFLVRDEEYLGQGITGVYWIYVAATAAALVATWLILTPKIVREATEKGAAATATYQQEEAADAGEASDKPLDENPSEDRAVPKPRSLRERIRRHPLANLRFTLFIFALLPVQTLFAHNWLTLPMYVERAFDGWLGARYEMASNFNALLIFVLLPTVTALTQKQPVYRMMIVGTLVMALPTFLLTMGPTPLTLFTFLVIMTVGEAMWQPRFLQMAAEIAPEGQTGAYMGVAQFPWFLTKVIVPFYSGWFLSRYCPGDITVFPVHPALQVLKHPPEPSLFHTEKMWFIYACIAMVSPVLLVLGKRYLNKGLDKNTAAA